MKYRAKKIFGLFQNEDKLEDFNKIKESNPSLWKKLKHQFDIGRKIVSIQLCNGLERDNEKVLRMYLNDYARRFLKYGPNSFPLSFNVLEPFFIFNHENSIIELLDEEESYGVSLIDFIDFITNPNFNLDKIDLKENIPEKIIYHFTFTSGVEKINFSNDDNKTFIIGSLSIVRQENEVSMLLQAGESYDKNFSEEYFKTHTRESVINSISTYKKSLGFEVDYKGEPKVVNYKDYEDFWQHSVAILFDIESKSIDIRHVARDENINYHIITDDFNAIFSKSDLRAKDKVKDSIKHYLNELSNYDPVFDFAKFCLALPYYVFENEDKIVDITYETSLKSILKSPIDKRNYSKIPNGYKTFAKPFYYLESNQYEIIESKSLNDNSFKIEKSGYWKRIGFDEEGFDKKGRKIIGKTWVERNDVYYINPKGITKVEQSKKDYFKDKNAGYIYVMRQPSHEENIFKVGLTQRSVEKRKSELSNTSSVDKFFVINSYYTRDCIRAEKNIHDKLKDYRLTSRREFFRCDLKIILDTCQMIIDEINE